MDAVKILSWTIVVVVIIVLITRQATKAIVFRKVGLDDGFILLASVFSIGLSVTTLFLAADGRGSSASFTSEQADAIFRGYYASEMFYVSAICFPKLSILVLFSSIVAGKRLIRHTVNTLGALILTWTLVSLIVIPVICEISRSWGTRSSHCLNVRVFWIIYCALDILSEVALVAISAKIVAYTQMQLSRKIGVVLCFAPRFLVVGVALTRLVWLYATTLQHEDQYRIWEPVIASQVQVCLSIITASIPFIMPYCRELDSRLQVSTTRDASKHVEEEAACSKSSSLWFRRHYKSGYVSSPNPSEERTVGYELLPRSSPCVPFTRSMTPGSTTALHFSPGNKSSERGLNIYIPHRSPTKQTSGLESQRSQSSGMLSPWSTSPQALLLHSFVPSRKAPVPPLRTPSLSPPTPSSCYTSPSASPTFSTQPMQRFLLPPHHQPIPGSPQPQRQTSLFLGERPIGSMRSTGDHSISQSSAKLSPPPRTSFSCKVSPYIQTPDYGPKGRLQTAPLSMPNQSRSQPESIQDLTSPMGAAIHNWFNSPSTQRLPQFSPLSPSSARDSFDQHAISPTESLRMPTYPLFSHTRSPARANAFPDRSSLSHNLYYSSCVPGTESTPLVQDVRSHPCVVVRNVF